MRCWIFGNAESPFVFSGGGRSCGALQPLARLLQHNRSAPVPPAPPGCARIIPLLAAQRRRSKHALCKHKTYTSVLLYVRKNTTLVPWGSGLPGWLGFLFCISSYAYSYA